MELDADSVVEASVFKSKSFRTSSKHRVEQTSLSSKGSLRLHDGDVNPNESLYSQLRNDNISSHECRKHEYLESGAAGSVLRHSEALDADDKLNSGKMTKVQLKKFNS